MIELSQSVKGALSTLLLFAAAGADSADNALTPEEAAAGWELLFDGSDMSQWRNFRKQDIDGRWIVEDGALVLSEKGAGDLITRRKYRNFELALDWRISLAGNSGVFILADEDIRVIYLHAPEIQLLDNERHADNEQEDHLSGSLYDMIPSPAASHRAAGEWNQLRILVRDRQLTVWQNGVVTAEVEIGGDRWKELVVNSKFRNWQGFGENETGHIGLQDHGDRVSFKNMKIRSFE